TMHWKFPVRDPAFGSPVREGVKTSSLLIFAKHDTHIGIVALIHKHSYSVDTPSWGVSVDTPSWCVSVEASS
ncbi:MAG TPA: hypothetical protein PKZ46_02645, partial [Candidatus Cloacimonadota bacterium]|nr:hypothetical protein [Candidatus Cloacimonadota bacterium]